MASFDKLALEKLCGSANYNIWSIRAEAVLTKEGYISYIRDNTEGLPLDLDKDLQTLAIIKLFYKDGPLL